MNAVKAKTPQTSMVPERYIMPATPETPPFQEMIMVPKPVEQVVHQPYPMRPARYGVTKVEPVPIASPPREYIVEKPEYERSAKPDYHYK